MTRKPDLNRISSERIAAADYASRRASARRDKAEAGDLFQTSMATLAMPGHPERTPEEAAAAAAKEAADIRSAMRSAVRIVMGAHGCAKPGCTTRHPVGGHGCSGPKCRRPGHAEAAALVREGFEALGLIPYEAARNPSYQWGRAGETG